MEIGTHVEHSFIIWLADRIIFLLYINSDFDLVYECIRNERYYLVMREERIVLNEILDCNSEHIKKLLTTFFITGGLPWALNNPSLGETNYPINLQTSTAEPYACPPLQFVIKGSDRVVVQNKAVTGILYEILA